MKLPIGWYGRMYERNRYDGEGECYVTMLNKITMFNRIEHST
ncbi:hypothetical protein [Bacteroides xylanisolvens]|nr:hypothetical protein [Bacteroides xylanisolvens]